MTHQAIEQHEIIERYARGHLSAEDKLSFEEHFFACDECFEKVQTMERFIAGIRHAAHSGLPETYAARRVEQLGFFPRIEWLKPALALAAGAALLLGVAAAWLWLFQTPRLREELARERTARDAFERDSKASLDNAESQIETERRERTKLQSQLEQLAQAKPQQSAELAGVEANLPLVMLEATRGTETANELVLPVGAKNLALWVEPEPATRYDKYRIEIYSMDDRLIHSLENVKKNTYGALAVSLPAVQFQTGKYRVKLFGTGEQKATLVAEYSLQVRKR